jgi:two-component system, chemotaxis family, response regulator Rcp1
MSRVRRILLIENSPADIMLLRMAMEDAGASAEIQVCEDGAVAIEHITSGAEPPDLILLDLNLPCHDGFEILDVLRATDSWSKTSVLVFTAAITPLDRQRLERMGALFLAKPQNYGGYVSAARVICGAARGDQVSAA